MSTNNSSTHNRISWKRLWLSIGIVVVFALAWFLLTQKDSPVTISAKALSQFLVEAESVKFIVAGVILVIALSLLVIITYGICGAISKVIDYDIEKTKKMLGENLSSIVCSITYIVVGLIKEALIWITLVPSFLGDLSDLVHNEDDKEDICYESEASGSDESD